MGAVAAARADEFEIQPLACGPAEGGAIEANVAHFLLRAGRPQKASRPTPVAALVGKRVPIGPNRGDVRWQTEGEPGRASLRDIARDGLTRPERCQTIISLVADRVSSG